MAMFPGLRVVVDELEGLESQPNYLAFFEPLLKLDAIGEAHPGSHRDAHGSVQVVVIWLCPSWRRRELSLVELATCMVRRVPMI